MNDTVCLTKQEQKYNFTGVLSRTQFYHLLDIWEILKQNSSMNYLVGGCVRDFMMGKDFHDLDIVTDVHMDISKPKFKKAGWKVDETGEKFLVLSISKDHQQYEVANFRKDGVYLDGRRPESVEIGTIHEDAARRDFTVNALYLDFDSGHIYDPNGTGLKDIENKVLRFIGKPKDRIKEDHLRIFRFYRFLTKGFRPHPGSLRACREYFTEAYSKITPERVRTELEKMI